MRRITAFALLTTTLLTLTGCGGGSDDKDATQTAETEVPVALYRGDKTVLEVFVLPDGTRCVTSRTHYSGSEAQGGVTCDWPTK